MFELACGSSVAAFATRPLFFEPACSLLALVVSTWQANYAGSMTGFV